MLLPSKAMIFGICIHTPYRVLYAIPYGVLSGKDEGRSTEHLETQAVDRSRHQFHGWRTGNSVPTLEGSKVTEYSRLPEYHTSLYIPFVPMLIVRDT